MAKRILILEGRLDWVEDNSPEGGVYVVGNDIVDVYLSELQGSNVIVTITSEDTE